MSSEEPLLRAENIHKVFISPTAPGRRLLRALVGDGVTTKDFPVLRGIDLIVSRGERVGIIGRNGAGKTTLLSILGGVTKPSQGHVTRNGRVAVLLGTSGAFNQNFTGRENAQLYARVMGFSAEDAAALVPQIEAFAELDSYFDMPVRTYSSGMVARLSFACAAHVEADLIILDEALAVGDAEYRMKCYAYMDERAQRLQSYLLVSHSPNIIANFCTRAVVLDQGKILFDGVPREANAFYKDAIVEKRRIRVREATPAVKSRAVADRADTTGLGAIDDAKIIFNASGEHRTGVLEITVTARQRIDHPVVKAAFRNHEGVLLFGLRTGSATPALDALEEGETLQLQFTIGNLFGNGQYWIDVGFLNGLIQGDEKIIQFVQHACRFSVEQSRTSGLVDLLISHEVTRTGNSTPASATPTERRIDDVRARPAPEKGDPPLILILGSGKSGTTALYYCLKQSAETHYSIDFPGLFEPKTADRIDSFVSKHGVIKMLLDRFLQTDAHFMGRFQKRVFILRDPRDALVSRLLWYAKTRLDSQNEETYQKTIQLFEQKQRDPDSIGVLELFNELVELLGDSTELDAIYGDDSFASYAVKSCFYPADFLDERSDQFFLLRYEDFVKNETANLATYVGFNIQHEFELGETHARVKRSAATGSWRNWFTDDDIEQFVSPNLNRLEKLGYKDHTPNREKLILPDEAALYLRRRDKSEPA